MKNNVMLHNQYSPKTSDSLGSRELLYIPSATDMASIVAAYKTERRGTFNSFTQMRKEIKIAKREVEKSKRKKIKCELVKLFINKKEVGGAFFQHSKIQKYCILNILIINQEERNKVYGDILFNEYLRFVEENNLIPVIELEKGFEEHCRYYYQKWGFTQISRIFFTESTALINPNTAKDLISDKVLHGTFDLLKSWNYIIPDKEHLISELLAHFGEIDTVFIFLESCFMGNSEALTYLKTLICTNKISTQTIAA